MKLTRGFYKIIAAVAAVGIVGVTATTMMVSSYNEWKVEYDAVISAKEEEDRLSKLPLTFEGIEASLSDSVSYYDNGRASPESEDFIVMAKFSEKGKPFKKRLKAEEYTVLVPDNFALEGGEIEIRYDYVPEVEEGEEVPEPVRCSAKINVSLKDVELTKLTLTSRPNVITYKEGEIFNPEGIKGTATYNDGTTIDVTEADITFDEKPLEAGATSVKVNVGRAETEVEIKVLDAASFTNGEVMTIEVEGDIYVEEGKTVGNLNAKVRGTYESGNKILLDPSEYTIVGNGTPSATAPYVVTASLKSMPSIKTEYLTFVQKAYETEVATLNGLTATTHNSVQGVKASNGGKITLTINAATATKSNATIKVANRGSADVSLNKVMSMKVNDRIVGVPASNILKGSDNASSAGFYDYALTGLSLNAGSNTVELSFANITSEDIVIDNISTISGGSGTVDNSFGFYLEDCIKKEKEPVVAISKAVDWTKLAGGGAYAHGLTNDGTYVYGVKTGYSQNNRPMYLFRYNPNDGTTIAGPSLTNAVTEANTGIAYHEGKIIVFLEDTRIMATDASTFSASSTFTQYDGFEFKEWENEVLSDVYYNSSFKKYVVSKKVSGNSFQVRIYNKDKETFMELPLKGVNGKKMFRVTGNNKYIYVTYAGDGGYQPTMQVYDWEGNHLGLSIIPNTPDKFSVPESAVGSTTSQGVTFLDDTIYFSMARWGAATGGDAGCLMKAVKAEDVVITNGTSMPSYTLGEYVDALKTKDTTAKPNITAAAMKALEGQLPKTKGQITDVASDGNYFYVSASTDNHTSSIIYQLEAKTLAVVASSKKIYYSDIAGYETGRLFIKDGSLYVSSASGLLYALELTKFGANCEFKLVEGTNVINPKNIIALYEDAHYEASLRKYATISTEKMNVEILSEDGTLEKSFDLSSTYHVIRDAMAKVDNYGAIKASSVTADEKYIYVNFATEGQTYLPLIVLDWSGNQIGETMNIDFAGLEMKGEYDISSLFMHKGTVHAVVRSLDGNGSYVWTLSNPAAI